MALEAGDGFISGLVATNPVNATDQVAQGDDHIRLIKAAVLGTFPNLNGAVNLTPAEANILDGATLSTAELNLLDGVTATTAELNILAGVTLTAAQINEAARCSASNTFTGGSGQTIAAVSAQLFFDETDGAANNRIWQFRTNNGNYAAFLADDAKSSFNAWMTVERTNNVCDSISWVATTHSFTGAVSVSGTSLLTGAVTAATIANSTSTTLVAGQLHFITGNATLPNLTAGQWVDVINDSGSAITISKNASDTTYWTATGASVSTSFTLAARGRLSAVCSPAGSVVYVSGNITAAT